MHHSWMQGCSDGRDVWMDEVVDGMELFGVSCINCVCKPCAHSMYGVVATYGARRMEIYVVK